MVVTTDIVYLLLIVSVVKITALLSHASCQCTDCSHRDSTETLCTGKKNGTHRETWHTHRERHGTHTQSETWHRHTKNGTYIEWTWHTQRETWHTEREPWHIQRERYGTHTQRNIARAHKEWHTHTKMAHTHTQRDMVHTQRDMAHIQRMARHHWNQQQWMEFWQTTKSQAAPDRLV